MSEKLTLQDMTDKLAARTGVTKKVSDDFLRELFALIVDSLAKDGLVKIKGLGTFKLKSVEERKSVNVQTGAEMVIPAHFKVTYTPDKGLSTDVNKPYAHLQTYILDQDGPIESPSYEDDEDLSSEDDVMEGGEKMDNSVFVISTSDDVSEDMIGRYYFNDEEVLAVQPEDVDAVSSDKKNGTKEEIAPVPSFTEAQPQEGQVIPTFTEQTSTLGTPSINPGPVVTLITDEATKEETSEPEVIEPKEETKVVEGKTLVEEPIKNEDPKVEEKAPESIESDENNGDSCGDSVSSQSEEGNVAVSEDAGNHNVDGPKEDGPVSLTSELNKNPQKRNSGCLIWSLAIVLLLSLLGIIAYMYQDKLNEVFGGVTFVQEPTPVVPEVETSSEEDANEEPESLESQMQEGAEMSSSDSVVVEASENQPRQEVVSPYSFDSELVEYMKANYPNEDISISGIKDEVKLTPGRRLVDLSLKYYGHKYFWVYIYFFNKDVIKNPNKLVPGTLIKIPELNPALVDKSSKAKTEMAFEIKKLIEK